MELYCENCGQKVIALKTQAGKTCNCPRCGVAIDVPKLEDKSNNQNAEYELTFLEISEVEKLRQAQYEQMEALELMAPQEQEAEPEETEEARKRACHWLLDIFLYPISKPGLIHLALFIALPLLLKILFMKSPVSLLIPVVLISNIAGIILFLYLYWYLAECIRDSAAGWVRAPEGIGGLPEFSDMVLETTNILGCLFFFLSPAMIYIFAVGNINFIAWFLIIPALFFYPAGLLSVLLHNSVTGLKWHIIINTIRTTFRAYVGLFLLYCILLYVAIVYMANQSGLLGKTTFRFFVIYFALIIAHLTGRLYWKNKNTLDWDV